MKDETDLRVLVVGRGAIGGVVAGALEDGRVPGAKLVAAVGRTDAGRLPSLLAGAHLLVEAAGHAALRQFGPAAISTGVDIIAASVGALAEEDLERDLAAGPGRVHLPSGAVGGLDLLAAAAANGGLDTVRLTSYKRAALLAQPWMDDAALTRLRSGESFTVFEGTTREAARCFPQSANVAATVGLRTLGLDRCRARIVAEADREGTTHLIEAQGTAGSYSFFAANAPAPGNPRTSLITAWSVLSTVAEVAGRPRLTPNPPDS